MVVTAAPIVELIPGSSFGAEARRRLAGFIASDSTESCQEQQAGQNEPRNNVSRSHAAELYLHHLRRLVRAGVWRQWNKWVLPISIQASKKEIASG
jgi:hypothetical protein